jgi:hypothetical protein
MRLGQATLAMALLFVTCAATARHSTALYSQERELTLEGVVEAFHWVSPQVSIEIAVVQEHRAPK